MRRMPVPRRTIALLAVVVLVAIAGCSGATNSAPEMGQQSSQLARSGGDGASASSGGGGVGSYYDDGDRVVVRESNMEVSVENFSQAFHTTREIAARYGGYVGDRSQDSRGDWDEGRITVRVPPENFSGARDNLARLGRLQDESVSVQDFTSQYRDRAGRIEDLEQEERALERLLENATDAEDVDRIRDDLREVRSQIRDLEQAQQSIEQRQAMSTIRLYLHEPLGDQPPKNFRTSFGFDDAFMEAFYGGLTAVKYVVVFFGYAIPIGLALLPLAAFGFGLLAVFRRLRRFSTALFADGEAVEKPAPERSDEDGTAEKEGVED